MLIKHLDPKKKRLLVATGIFVLPIVVILIAIHGLLHPTVKKVPAPSTASAFNTDLPQPNLPKTEKNKLELYMQAHDDSVKRSQQRANDPYASPAAPSASPASNPLLPPGPAAIPPHPDMVTSPFKDDNEKKVNDRLQKIYAALQSAPPAYSPDQPPSRPSLPPAESPSTSEASQLQNLMASIQKPDTTPNPQLAQVKQVLDEIKDIQHPQHMSPFPTSSSGQSRPLQVGTQPPSVAENDNRSETSALQNGFYGLTDETDSSGVAGNTIEAVVNGDQLVQTGSIVKLRLLQPIYIGQVRIPANAFIYGPATISGERVAIDLTNAIYDAHIYPISLKVYDGGDGLEGLYVPGMITRDVIKQNMSQNASSIPIGSFDPSLGAQAAAASIETARNLLSRKIAMVKATLKAGHLAILKPASSQH